MSKQTMISMSYDRIPQKTLYEAETKVAVVVVVGGATTVEEPIKRIGKSGVEMGELITDLNKLLNTHPDAVVTMVRGTTRPTYFGQRTPRGFELDTKMRDLIRDDLEEAKKAFAPMEQTVQVRPTPPRIAIKE